MAYSWGGTSGSRGIYYRLWENGNWTDQERVDYGKDDLGNNTPTHSPQIAVDIQGIPHIIWSAETSTICMNTDCSIKENSEKSLGPMCFSLDTAHLKVFEW